MNDFETTLGTALREQVADVRPDVGGLVDASVRTGVRLRRRRRLTVAGGALATAAVIGGVGVLLSPGGGTAEDPGFAEEPSATPTPQSRPDTLGPLEEYLATLDTSYGVDPEQRSVQVPSDVTYNQRREISALVPRRWEVEFLDFDAPAVGLLDEVPVVDAPGWTCEWFLVDDKAACESADGGVAGLVVRDGADHAQWSTDPDKGGPGSGSYVTDVHDGVFISVQPGLGTTDAELRALRDGLVFKD